MNTEDGSHVVAALCQGYEIVSGFHYYDDKTGEVDYSCNPIYLGEDGNTYKWSEDIITSVFDTRKEA